MITAAVVGASGYAGGELLRLLSAHPAVEVGALAARNEGRAVSAVHPQLAGLADAAISALADTPLVEHDVVFLALPHGHSAEIAAALPDDVLVVDCAADHRLESAADWTAFYGAPHAGTWVYGLPELTGQRAALAGAKRIAAPGCFPTAAALALVPAVSAGLISGSDVVVTAATGASGAGRSPRADLLAAELIGSAAAYGVGGGHRHIPEIEQCLRTAGAVAPRVTFTPVLVPLSRGILAVCTSSLATPSTSGDVRAAYEKATADEPFWRLLPAGEWPRSGSVTGSNSAQVQVTVDAHTGGLTAVCVIDNLAKGTAGSAIQAMNLALGLPETTGLPVDGVAP